MNKYEVLYQNLQAAITDQAQWQQYEALYNSEFCWLRSSDECCRIHSLYVCILALRKEGYSLKMLHVALSRVLKSSGLHFHPVTYNNFTKSLREAQAKSIKRVVIHAGSRNSKKQTIQYWRSKAIGYFVSRQYTYQEIASLLNSDLVSRGDPPVSLSMIKRFYNSPAFKKAYRHEV